MLRLQVYCVAISGWLWTANVAHAGMPAIGLSEVGRLRTQTISFFLLGLLISAGVIQWIWNSLRSDWPAVPRLGYWRAVGLVTLWGLFFVIVLTMISGARELLTPGAWEKNGLTYRVKTESDPRLHDDEARAGAAELVRRSEKLRRLGEKLREFAAEHDGVFPTEAGDLRPDDLWELPTLGRSRYLYFAGRTLHDSADVLAREPAVFDGPTLVLLVSGEVRTADEVGKERP